MWCFWVQGRKFGQNWGRTSISLVLFNYRGLILFTFGFVGWKIPRSWQMYIFNFRFFLIPIVYRQLAVPSLDALTQTLTPQSTSLDAGQKKKTWTSHSCQKRWKWWKDFKCWIFDADLIPICILFPCRASSNSTPTELTKQANISFWAAQ